MLYDGYNEKEKDQVIKILEAHGVTFHLVASPSAIGKTDKSSKDNMKHIRGGRTDVSFYAFDIDDLEFEKVTTSDILRLNNLRIYREMPMPPELEESTPTEKKSQQNKFGNQLFLILSIVMLLFAAWRWFTKYSGSLSF